MAAWTDKADLHSRCIIFQGFEMQGGINTHNNARLKEFVFTSLNSPLTTAVPLNSGAFICGCSIDMVDLVETLKLNQILFPSYEKTLRYGEKVATFWFTFGSRLDKVVLFV